jgi:hypothetical protein
MPEYNCEPVIRDGRQLAASGSFSAVGAWDSQMGAHLHSISKISSDCRRIPALGAK